jgi:hypothetical protein
MVSWAWAKPGKLWFNPVNRQIEHNMMGGSQLLTPCGSAKPHGILTLFEVTLPMEHLTAQKSD